MWTTLQFYWRLGFEVTIASSFLKHALHLTLPLIATTAIAHAFKEYCRGRGGGSTDFAALATLYVFVFHLMMGVRLVRPASLRFGVGGGGGGVPWPWGRGRGTLARGKWTQQWRACRGIVRAVVAQWHCWGGKRAAEVLRCWWGIGGGVG